MRGVERPAYQPIRDIRRSSTLAAVRQRQQQEAARAAARREQFRIALIPIALVLLLALGGYWWWRHHEVLPAGIVRTEGRLEIVEIPVTLPFPGIIQAMLVSEGDAVTAGQLLARLDVAAARTELDRLETTIDEDKTTLDSAQADVAQRKTQVQSAEQEVRLAMAHGTRQNLDQRRAAREAVIANLAKAVAAQTAADQALAAAREQADRLRQQVAQDKLVAPRDGRVAYRLAEPGESLPAGAPVLTLVDPAGVFARFTVPADAAQHIAAGDEARVMLAADPQHVAAGTVGFAGAQVATEDDKPKAKDTGKPPVVVKVALTANALALPAATLRSGEKATGYIRTMPDAAWPSGLQPRS